MADTFTSKERSRIMRAVKSKGNRSTELRLIQCFREKGIRGWRRNYKLYGKPDFVFPKLKIAVFADGCFWHGHDCRNLKPDSNAEYWIKKIERNKKRDREVTRYLKAKDWRVFRIFECRIKNSRLPPSFLKMFS